MSTYAEVKKISTGKSSKVVDKDEIMVLQNEIFNQII